MKLADVASRRGAVVLALSALLLANHAAPAGAATATLTLSARTGPPATVLVTKGQGFGASERIDLSFDSTNLVVARAGSTGAFSGVRLTVPLAATPGAHQVRAVGRVTGRVAKAAFQVLPPVPADWPQLGGGPGHQGYNAGERVLGVANVAQLRERRSVAADIANPVVAGGTVFGIVESRLIAIDAATGATKWTAFQGRGYRNVPAVGGGRVYAANWTGQVVAFDSGTGAILWSATVDVQPLFSSPAVAGDTVYVKGDNFADQTLLFALDAATGATRWQTNLGNFSQSTPAVADGRVFLGGGNEEKLFALDAATGAIAWSVQLPTIAHATPVVADGVVYFNAGDLYAFDAATGGIRWTRKAGTQFGSPLQFAQPAVANGIVYASEAFFGANPLLHALNATTGADVWRLAGALSPPAVANGVAYVNATRLLALNASTGAVLWTGPALATAFTLPIVANGQLIARSPNTPTTNSLRLFSVA